MSGDDLIGDERRAFEQRLQRLMPNTNVEPLGDHGTQLTKKNPLCDFCCDLLRGAGHTMPAHDIKIGDTPAGEFISKGDWGACDECKALIDIDDREGLLARRVAIGVRDYGNAQRSSVTRHARAAHAAYFAARVREN